MAEKKAAAKKAAKKTSKKTVKTVISERPSTAGVKTTPLKKPSVTEHKMPAGQIVVNRIAKETIRVPILGTAPLITNKFSEKSIRQMLDGMQNRKSPKQPKDPEAEYEAAAYHLDDGGYGILANAFKLSIVNAARYFGKSVSMVALKSQIFVECEFSKAEGLMLARIEGEPYMREDIVRVGNGGTDLRYRPCWNEWSTTIDVVFVKNTMTRDSVLSLIDAAGFGVGVGEWRPDKKGECGRYVIDPSREVEVLTQ